MILYVVFNVHYSLKSVINFFFLYLQLLGFAKLKLKEAISKEPTLLTQDIAGYKVMLLSQCFFNIKDSFIFMFLFFPYYFARQQKTWRSSMLTILPPNWCYLCGTLSLWTPFFLPLDVNSKCCKREDWGTHTHGIWFIKNDVHSLAKICMGPTFLLLHETPDSWYMHFF